MVTVDTREFQISTGHGRLFAKSWTPSSEAQASATPIILFHDSLGCVELWRDFPQQLALASGRSVHAYDRLGFGRSDAHPVRLATDFIHAEALGAFRQVREALQLDEFIAFGHSVGGGMAVGCAAAWGAQCRGLITESAQAFVEDRTVQGIRTAQQAFAEPGQLERLRRYHGDKAAWVLSAWIDSWLAPDFAGWNLDEDLRQVRCPALVIHGEHDEYGSSRHPQRIAGEIGQAATLRILPDCAHVPHRERTDVVLDEVLRWLDTVDGAPNGPQLHAAPVI